MGADFGAAGSRGSKAAVQALRPQLTDAHTHTSERTLNRLVFLRIHISSSHEPLPVLPCSPTLYQHDMQPKEFVNKSEKISLNDVLSTPPGYGLDEILKVRV